MNIFQNEIKEVFPELFLIIGIIMVWTHGTLYSASIKHKFPILTKTIGWIGIQILIIETLILIGKTRMETKGIWIDTEELALYGTIIIDEFTMLIKIIVILSAIATIGISFNYIKNKKINKNEWVTLILTATLSSILLVSSFDLISIYLAIELQSLIFYTLAAYNRNNEFSTEAGLKYFILGALSSGLLLFGISIIYGITGITNLEEITKLIMVLTQGDTFQNTTIKHIDLINIGLILIIIAFLFKIGAVPFHMWTPDVYEGAPTIVTAYFAITPKIAIVGTLIRICLYSFYDLIEIWQNIIITSAILSMFLGTFGAIKQKKIKRLIAYSGIAHIGYILISIGTGTIEAIEAMLIYIIAYIIITINIFGIILIMTKENMEKEEIKEQIYYKKNINQENKEKKWIKYLEKGNPIWEQEKKIEIPQIKIMKKEDKIEYIKHLTDFSTLSKTNPILAITMGIILFSNAGIPPLAGFYGKLNIFLTAIENGLYIIAIASIICSVIGAFYSIRLIKIIWYHSMKEEKWKLYKPINKENGYIITITFFFTILFFLAPSLIFIMTHEAALSLCI